MNRLPRWAGFPVTVPAAAWFAAAMVGATILLGAIQATDPVAAGIECPIGALDTRQQPPVDVDHIFCGEINARNRAVGFHSRPGGVNPRTVGDTDDITVDAPFPGAYEIRDFTITVDAISRTKSISTMFPDDCSYDDVLAAIRHAYDNRTSANGNRFFGPSGPTCRDRDGDAFDILGYTMADGGDLYITTAFPQ